MKYIIRVDARQPDMGARTHFFHLAFPPLCVRHRQNNTLFGVFILILLPQPAPARPQILEFDWFCCFCMLKNASGVCYRTLYGAVFVFALCVFICA
jgi:hypothetical protein